MNLYQYDDGYKYNSDSLLLYDFISSLKPKGKLLDVGAGCGIIGLLLKRDFSNLELFQLDIQEKNTFLNQKNSEMNSLESTIIQGDFLKEVLPYKFDFIISNPPFYDIGSKQSENLSLQISRYTKNLPFEEFCKKVSQSLTPRGSFVFCYDSKQLDKLVYSLHVNKLNIEEMRFIHTKPSKISNLVMIHAKKSSKSLIKIHPPLFVQNEDGVRNEVVEEIFKKAGTKSFSWKN